jgi:hypothetical protein
LELACATIPAKLAADRAWLRGARPATPSNKELKLTKPSLDGASQLNSVFDGLWEERGGATGPEELDAVTRTRVR